jgi:hypothetical protein
MKIIFTLTLLTLFILSTTSFANDSLMHLSHEKLKEAQSQMEVIKKTKDPVERKKLLDQHMKTMQELNELTLQIQVDPDRGGAGQGTQMQEIMFERVHYLEQMMQQLLENQSERAKIEDMQ